MPQRGDAYEFIDNTGASVFFTESEKMEAADLLQPVLDSVRPEMGADWYHDNADLDAFFEYTGLSEDSPMFWEAFREWYGENG